MYPPYIAFALLTLYFSNLPVCFTLHVVGVYRCPTVSSALLAHVEQSPTFL